MQQLERLWDGFSNVAAGTGSRLERFITGLFGAAMLGLAGHGQDVCLDSVESGFDGIETVPKAVTEQVDFRTHQKPLL